MTDASTDRLILGRALRALRQQAGITQKELATRISSSEAYVSHTETGRLDIRWHTLQRLLAALNADLHKLARQIDQDGTSAR
jgi:transcriptional regulator with XRE-family HTH domain